MHLQVKKLHLYISAHAHHPKLSSRFMISLPTLRETTLPPRKHILENQLPNRKRVRGSQSNENDKTGIFDRFFLIANFCVLEWWLTLVKKIGCGILIEN